MIPLMDPIPKHDDYVQPRRRKLPTMEELKARVVLINQAFGGKDLRKKDPDA